MLTGGRETGTLEQQAGGAEPVQPHAPVDRLRSLALNSATSYRCRRGRCHSVPVDPSSCSHAQPGGPWQCSACALQPAECVKLSGVEAP